MKAGVFCVVLLGVLALVPSSTSRRVYPTCICQLESDLYTRGKMVGSSCYVLGMGYCGTFRAEQRRFSPRRRARPSPFKSSYSYEQRLRAQEAARRQLAAQRRQQQVQLRSGFGVVRPGSPSAALAQEKRADDKSLALGQQALAQILYLQNLVGSGRR